MTKLRQRIRKVADTKSSPSTLIQKSIVFKLFHSGKRFQKVPFSRTILCGCKRIGVDGRRIRNNKVAFSNLSGIVWTGPKFALGLFGLQIDFVGLLQRIDYCGPSKGCMQPLVPLSFKIILELWAAGTFRSPTPTPAPSPPAPRGRVTLKKPRRARANNNTINVEEGFRIVPLRIFHNGVQSFHNGKDLCWVDEQDSTNKFPQTAK